MLITSRKLHTKCTVMWPIIHMMEYVYRHFPTCICFTQWYKVGEYDGRHYFHQLFQKLVKESDNRQTLLSGNMVIKVYPNLKRKARPSSLHFSALLIIWNYSHNHKCHNLCWTTVITIWTKGENVFSIC
jgi:hypothetical protein